MRDSLSALRPETPIPSAPPRLSTDSAFGRYRIVRKIGEGGMASIYLAHSSGPDGFSKPCALKLIRPEFSTRPEIAQMMVREARLAGFLNHPHIVQVFDFGKVADDYYLAMEWVDGAPLSRLIVEAIRLGRPLSIGTAAHVAHAVGDALAYLQDGVVIDGQRVNIVHRDVSPSNVLVSSAGVVKLTDFGIVKVLDAPTQTQAGIVKGKYGYMSPEQVRGDPVDHRSDIYSLGVILFEMLTRQRLFRRKTLAATVAAMHAARVPPPSSINPDIPHELDQVVLRALAKRPGDRYGTAREMVEDLWPFVSTGSKRGAAELAELIVEMDRLPVALPRGASVTEADGEVESEPDLLDPVAVGTDDLVQLEELAGDLIDIAGDADVHATGATWEDSARPLSEASWPSAPGAAAARAGSVTALIPEVRVPSVSSPPAPPPPSPPYVAVFDDVLPSVRVSPPAMPTEEADPPTGRRATYVAAAVALIGTLAFWAWVLSSVPR